MWQGRPNFSIHLCLSSGLPVSRAYLRLQESKVINQVAPLPCENKLNCRRALGSEMPLIDISRADVDDSGLKRSAGIVAELARQRELMPMAGL